MFKNLVQTFTDNYQQNVAYTQCLKCQDVFSSNSWRSIRLFYEFGFKTLYYFRDHFNLQHSEDAAGLSTDSILDDFIQFIVGDARAFNLVDTQNFRTFFTNVVPKM